MIDEPTNNEFDETDEEDYQPTQSEVLVRSAIEQDPESFRSAFIDSIHARVAAGIEARTPEIASAMFAGEPVTEPEED